MTTVVVRRALLHTRATLSEPFREVRVVCRVLMSVRTVGAACVPSIMSTLRCAIGHVLFLCAELQMFGVDTCGVIAAMHHHRAVKSVAIRNRSAIHFPREAMCERCAIAVLVDTVSTAILAARPHPARRPHCCVYGTIAVDVALEDGASHAATTLALCTRHGIVRVQRAQPPARWVTAEANGATSLRTRTTSPPAVSVVPGVNSAPSAVTA